jgi:penicillin-insensitive murein DD-endopeptidase
MNGPRSIAHALSFALPLAVGVASTTSAQARAVEVRASLLNVREGPGTTYAVRGRLTEGQTYALVAERGVWAQLELGGRRLWASQTYLRPTGALLVEVRASELNVRTGPAVRYRALGRVPQGTLLVERRRSGSWVQISFQGTAAWVHGDWIRTANTTARPSPPATAPRTQPRPTTPAAPSRPRSRAGFIQLPAAGTGFESYARPAGRWGRPELIYGLERASRRWSRERTDRIGVGDISLAAGGYFAPHSSHRDGRDVDLALVRSDRRELPTTIYQSVYDRRGTARVLELIRSEVRVELTLFNDRQVPGVQAYPGHDNHMHVRIR